MYRAFLPQPSNILFFVGRFGDKVAPGGVVDFLGKCFEIICMPFLPPYSYPVVECARRNKQNCDLEIVQQKTCQQPTTNSMAKHRNSLNICQTVSE